MVGRAGKRGAPDVVGEEKLGNIKPYKYPREANL